MNIVTKAFAWKMAGEVPDGSFEGTALVYGEKDALGDSIREGAFAKSIHDNAGAFPLLWSHSPLDVLGSVAVTSDRRALQVSGRLLVDDVPRAREVHALMRAKSVRGLSVAFIPVRTAARDDGIDFIEARLVEISLTAIPAYESAMVTSMKSLDMLVRSLDARHDRDALIAIQRTLDTMIRDGDGDDPGELLAALSLDPARWR